MRQHEGAVDPASLGFPASTAAMFGPTRLPAALRDRRHHRDRRERGRHDHPQHLFVPADLHARDGPPHPPRRLRLPPLQGDRRRPGPLGRAVRFRQQLHASARQLARPSPPASSSRPSSSASRPAARSSATPTRENWSPYHGGVVPGRLARQRPADAQPRAALRVRRRHLRQPRIATSAASTPTRSLAIARGGGGGVRPQPDPGGARPRPSTCAAACSSPATAAASFWSAGHEQLAAAPRRGLPDQRQDGAARRLRRLHVALRHRRRPPVRLFAVDQHRARPLDNGPDVRRHAGEPVSERRPGSGRRPALARTRSSAASSIASATWRACATNRTRAGRSPCSANCPHQWLLELGYVGSRGFDLTVEQNDNTLPRQYLSTAPARDQATINFLTTNVTNPFAGLLPGEGLNSATTQRQQLLRPFPQFNDIQTWRYDGSSHYHALQSRVERRFAQGYTVLFAYTYSAFTDRNYMLNFTDDGPTEAAADADVPHRFAFSGILELPFGHGRRWGADANGFVNALIGDWTVTAIALDPERPADQLHRSRPQPLLQRRSRRAVGQLFERREPAGLRPLRASTSPTRRCRPTASSIRSSSATITRISLANNVRYFPHRLGNLRSQALNEWQMSFVKRLHHHAADPRPDQHRAAERVQPDDLRGADHRSDQRQLRQGHESVQPAAEPADRLQAAVLSLSAPGLTPGAARLLGAQHDQRIDPASPGAPAGSWPPGR